MHARKHPFGAFRFPTTQVTFSTFRTHDLSTSTYSKPLRGGFMSLKFIFLLLTSFLLRHFYSGLMWMDNNLSCLEPQQDLTTP